MATQRKRSRHAVPGFVLSVLRLLGRRYSPTRDAWVHRLAGGRRGPVFRDRQSRPTAAPAQDVGQLDAAFEADPPSATVPLPQRARRTDRTAGLPADRADGLDDSDDSDGEPGSVPPAEGPAEPVAEVAPSEPGPPGEPRVDGRPPRREDLGFRTAKPSLRAG